MAQFSPRMSPELLGAKNKWLTCDALARIFVCYCVSFFCMVFVLGNAGGHFRLYLNVITLLNLHHFFFFCVDISKEKVASPQVAN